MKASCLCLGGAAPPAKALHIDAANIANLLKQPPAQLDLARSYVIGDKTDRALEANGPLVLCQYPKAAGAVALLREHVSSLLPELAANP